VSRSFEQDALDVQAAQSGDQEAMQRLVDEYMGAMMAWSKGWSHRFDAEERRQICALTLLEVVRESSSSEARRLRSFLPFRVKDAMDAAAFPELNPTDVQRSRKAVALMQEKVQESDPDQLQFRDAAAVSRVSLHALEFYRSVESPLLLSELDSSAESELDALADDRESSSISSFSPSVEAELLRLSPHSRRCVELAVSGLSDSEVAEEMGIKYAAAVKLRQRAFASLRTALSCPPVPAVLSEGPNGSGSEE